MDFLYFTYSIVNEPRLVSDCGTLVPIDPQFGTTLSAQSLAVRTFRSSTVPRSLSMRSFGHLIWLGDCRPRNLAIYDQATYFYCFIYSLTTEQDISAVISLSYAPSKGRENSTS